MVYVMLGLFSLLSIAFVLLNIKIIYLLIKLGFYYPVIASMVVEWMFVAIAVAILTTYGFTTNSLFLASLMIGMFVPGLFKGTTKKVDPKKRKTKPKYMSEAEWNWLDYDIGHDTESSIGGGGW